jgi:hypothetical protein
VSTGKLHAPKTQLISPLLDARIKRTRNTMRASADKTLAFTADKIGLRHHDFATVVPRTESLNNEIVNGLLLGWITLLTWHLASPTSRRETARSSFKVPFPSSIFEIQVSAIHSEH